MKDTKNTNKRLKVHHILFLILLVCGTVYVAQDHNTSYENKYIWTSKEIKKCSGNIFGTIYNITYKSETDLHDSIKHVLNEIDYSLSPFNKKSNISAINNNITDIPDKRMTEVFKLAQNVYEKTFGAFDITIAPFVNLWGFGFENSSNVSAEKIDSLKNIVGFDKIIFDDAKIIKQNPNIKLDCSAIAKGYGVDAIGVFLESKGVTNYMVEIGGEIRARGLNPKGSNWRIGITNPQDDIYGNQNEIEKILTLTDISLATSGNYRNFYIKDNKKYAHTIDPRTGYPVQHNILSSTVIAKDCATADAYATAFMVLGLDSAITVLNQNPEISAFFIYSVDSIKTATWHSPILSEIIQEP
jgi:thiamine biosynthesis lipoprotein